MSRAAPDGHRRRTAGRTLRTPALRRRLGTLAASALIATAAVLPGSSRADPGLPADVQAALAGSLAASSNGALWVEPAELSRLLAAHPERAPAVARVAAQLISPDALAWSESPCTTAATLARALGAAAPEQALDIERELFSALPECGATVTQAMEEQLAGNSAEAVAGERMQSAFASAGIAQPARGGTNIRSCRGGCQTTEPSDPQIISQFAF